jgi:hypothetical protein
MLRLVGHDSGVFRPLNEREPAFEIPAALSFTSSLFGNPLLFTLSNPTGNLTILGNYYGVHGVFSGNLTVSGTNSYVNTTNTFFKSNFPLVNSSATSYGDAGFIAQRYQIELPAGGGGAGNDIVALDTATESGALLNAIATKVSFAITASGVDDYYNGWWVQITSGAADKTVRRVIDYDGATLTATVNNMAVIPGIGDTYKLYPRSYVVSFYDWSTDTWCIGATPNAPALNSDVSLWSYLDLQVNDITAADLSALDITATTIDLKEYAKIEASAGVFPGPTAGHGYLLTRVYSGITELYYEDSAGNTCRLTEAGIVNFAGAIGTGVDSLFWEINQDATALVAEDSYLLLSGADGAHLCHNYLIQDHTSGHLKTYYKYDGHDSDTLFSIGNVANTTHSAVSQLHLIGYDTAGAGTFLGASLELSCSVADSWLNINCDTVCFNSKNSIKIMDVLDQYGRITALAPAVSVGNESRVYYNQSVQEQKISENGSAYQSYIVGTRVPTDYSVSVTPDQFHNISVDGSLTWDDANKFFVLVRKAGSGAGYFIVPTNSDLVRSAANKGMYLTSVVLYYRMQNTDASATLTCDLYSNVGRIEGSSPVSSQHAVTYSLDAAGRRSLYTVVTLGGTVTETFHFYHMEFKFSTSLH